jgi:cell division protein FtsX
VDIKLVDITLHIDETLDHAKLEGIADKLRQQDGVVSVAFHDDKPHMMVVQYNPEKNKSADILKGVTAQGVHAELIGL